MKIALALFLAWTGLAPAADFTYMTRMHVTDGVMADFMKRAGRATPLESTTITMVSGGKMVQKTGDSLMITDTNTQLMTMVDLSKGTYSVATIQEMLDLMERMPEMTRRAQVLLLDDADAAATPAQADVRVTKAEPVEGPLIAGVSTTLYEGAIETITIAEDPKTKQQVTRAYTVMGVQIAMGKPPGSEAINEVESRFGGSGYFNTGAIAQGVAQTMLPPNVTAREVSEIIRWSNEREGIVMRSVSRIFGSPDSSSGIFGTLGRALADDEKPDAGSPKPGQPVLLMEITQEVVGFNTESVDPIVFQVSPELQQVENPMREMLRGR